MVNVFFNSVGRIRSGWRFAFFVILFLFAWVLLSILLLPVMKYLQLGDYGLMLASSFITLVVATVVGWFCGKLFEELPYRAIGWSLGINAAKNFLTGSILGALSLLFAAMLAMFGGLSFTVNKAGTSLIIQSLLLSVALFVVAAAAEEAMFRGYALQTLTRARFIVIAIVLTAMPFGLVHTQNPDFTAISFVNTVLAGVWFGIAYLKTRDLWFPLGIHWAWNFTMGSILGLPVSGLKLAENPVLISDDKSPIWLGGGTYGLEGGIVSIIAIMVSMLVIWRVPFLKPTAEMFSLTNQENISQQTKIDNYLKDNAFRG